MAARAHLPPRSAPSRRCGLENVMAVGFDDPEEPVADLDFISGQRHPTEALDDESSDRRCLALTHADAQGLLDKVDRGVPRQMAGGEAERVAPRGSAGTDGAGDPERDRREGIG
jgi:hypothetical protein